METIWQVSNQLSENLGENNNWSRGNSWLYSLDCSENGPAHASTQIHGGNGGFSKSEVWSINLIQQGSSREERTRNV